MPISRFLFFSSKHRFRQPLNLIRRFDLSKRTQSCSYTKSSRQSHRNPADYFLSPQETKASRSWSTYVIPAGGLLGLAGIATFVHYNDERRAVRKGTSVCQCVKEKKFEVRFIFTWANYELGDYSVSALCPYSVTMSALPSMVFSDSKKNLKILPIFVTIDPQRDTPAHLRAYLKEFNSRIVGLTGPVGAIRQMAQEYRVFFKKVEDEGDDYLVESSHNMYFMNPSLEVVRCFGVEYTAEELAEEISKEMKKAST
ncbi:protein SCO1 homolog 2, mitochondrial isoform X3 [Citrus sinensis]|uniref:protein SCO1 homolog 2, mitochondrial isoform X3 n=1 Tax=Citrus sinensis TaxID=2711 RepID=UPI000D62E8F2|nr:protein SCO1 homolog 2, mitochondrial isoform X3 [Citrus sinensis]